MTGPALRSRRPVRRPAPESGAAIEARDLRKTYTPPSGEVQAVRGVDLEVRHGEFFGLLGPNGAGKSTTIGMLTTLVTPTGGTARVSGFDVARDPLEVKRRIGVMGQFNTLDRELSVIDNLEFRGRYVGMRRAEARARAEHLLERFGLADRRDAEAAQLSGGQMRRMMIARTLINRPEVLFLDEPTAGIDPQTRINLWEVLREMNAGGQTVLLTTHHLEEAEALCERVAIIDKGRVLACDTVEALKKIHGDTVITATYDVRPSGVPETLRAREGVRAVTISGEQIRVVTTRPEGLLRELIDAGAAEGADLLDITTLRPSLESVFLALTGREYRDEHVGHRPAR
ncbi:ABC transporter ATP-binding protein [Microbispora siamensis]